MNKQFCTALLQSVPHTINSSNSFVILKRYTYFERELQLTLPAMILCTSSSGETGVLARSGLELLILLERASWRLLGRTVVLDKVAYCIGMS